MDIDGEPFLQQSTYFFPGTLKNFRFKSSAALQATRRCAHRASMSSPIIQRRRFGEGLQVNWRKASLGEHGSPFHWIHWNPMIGSSSRRFVNISLRVSLFRRRQLIDAHCEEVNPKTILDEEAWQHVATECDFCGCFMQCVNQAKKDHRLGARAGSVLITTIIRNKWTSFNEVNLNPQPETKYHLKRVFPLIYLDYNLEFRNLWSLELFKENF